VPTKPPRLIVSRRLYAVNAAASKSMTASLELTLAPRLRESTLFDEANIVSEDNGMIEGEWQRRLIRKKQGRTLGVVLCGRRS
jgi:hypothetical protein